MFSKKLVFKYFNHHFGIEPLKTFINQIKDAVDKLVSSDCYCKQKFIVINTDERITPRGSTEVYQLRKVIAHENQKVLEIEISIKLRRH